MENLEASKHVLTIQNPVFQRLFSICTEINHQLVEFILEFFPLRVTTEKSAHPNLIDPIQTIQNLMDGNARPP
uniref:AlNc14C24G2416 protein n=1 Tax=Albugo laibachii Nc14 TaxID=890382 RepID=F0W6B7_9STRA|nr:AlNc14C24G2416 [Albugo laibachii Nc14]|eukprot:CCA16660.1 AlNc14C24G2416 [Albugo laibachii Nc14]